MNIINLTHKTITIITEEGKKRILLPSGPVARVSSQVRELRKVDGIQLVTTVLGEVTDLPPEEEGILLVVSGLVKQKAGRKDLVSPANLVRDSSGVVIGCKALSF
jgi:hypothetical protein